MGNENIRGNPVCGAKIETDTSFTLLFGLISFLFKHFQINLDLNPYVLFESSTYLEHSLYPYLLEFPLPQPRTKQLLQKQWDDWDNEI